MHHLVQRNNPARGYDLVLGLAHHGHPEDRGRYIYTVVDSLMDPGMGAHGSRFVRCVREGSPFQHIQILETSISEEPSLPEQYASHGKIDGYLVIQVFEEPQQSHPPRGSVDACLEGIPANAAIFLPSMIFNALGC